MMKPLVIHVRSSGHDNRASAPVFKVVASCTSSPEEAARRLAVKILGNRPFKLVCEIKASCCPVVVGRYMATLE
jgi:hypothetical protein